MFDENEDRRQGRAAAQDAPCPECSKPSHREHYPFCSNRCREVDLSRWLTGSYAIPVADDETKAEYPDED